MKKLLTLAALMALTACSCKNSEIKSITSIKAMDRHLSCGELEVAITEAEHIVKSMDRKQEVLPAYSEYPGCIFVTVNSALRAEQAAEDRVEYLNGLYSLRCSRKVAVRNFTKKTKKSNVQITSIPPNF